MQSDCELLRQYIEDKSETAFAELVRRHLGLVYSAAIRQVGSHSALAEDITQTVFINLVRQAPVLVRHETLVGWLHTSVRYTALRSLRDLRRRQAREQKAIAMQMNATPNIPWEQIRPVLDEAVGELSETDRQAVLLRYFQGRSHREVGEALGQTEDAARVRVNRALEKLRQIFARRGVVTTEAILGEIILTNAAEAEPVGLAGRVNKNAASAAKVAAVGWSGLVLRLIFMTTKNKILIAAALILLAWLFTLGLPRWVGAFASDPSPESSISKASSVMPKNGLSAVQLPQAAPVPASSSKVATTAAIPSALDGSSQPSPKNAPAPPPLPGRGPGGAGFGKGANNFRSQYANFFAKMNFTQAQQDAFIKTLSNNQDQLVAAFQSAKSKLSDAQFNELMNNAEAQIMNDPGPHDPLTMFGQELLNKEYDLLGITAQIQAIKDNTETQLRQALGTNVNYAYYQSYTSNGGIRQWVANGFSNALQSAGLPDLSVDQQEALVDIVAGNLQQGPSDPVSSLNHVQQVANQASAVLSPNQIEVLTKNLQQPAGLSYARFNKTP
jgi:RNA polymerase sigma factor (sigma-70 family)